MVKWIKQEQAVWPHPDQGDHHVPVRLQHEGVQGAGSNGQKERIRWKQPNSKQDCAKDRAGQQEEERDSPGQEVEQAIWFSPWQRGSWRSFMMKTDSKNDHSSNRWFPEILYNRHLFIYILRVHHSPIARDIFLSALQEIHTSWTKSVKISSRSCVRTTCPLLSTN